MKLSQHFDLSEFLRSETAVRHDLVLDPSPAVIANLRRLAADVLEPIRLRCGAPLVVTSGYRSPELNALVRGSDKSDHMTGCAADIHAIGISLVKLAAAIEDLRADIPLKQSIAEFGSWIHVSVQPEGEEPRREFLTASRVNGATVYTPGMAFFA